MTESNVTPAEKVPKAVQLTFGAQMITSVALAGVSYVINIFNPDLMNHISINFSYSIGITRFFVPAVTYADQIQNPPMHLNSTLLEFVFSSLFIINSLTSIIYIFNFAKLVRMNQYIIFVKRTSTATAARICVFMIFSGIYCVFIDPYIKLFSNIRNSRIEIIDYIINSIAPTCLFFFGILALANAYAYLGSRRTDR